MRDLTAMLHPRSVTIVGASNDASKVRGMAVASLLRSGFSGPVYPVNPGYDTIQGLPAYPNVGAIEGDIDLAILVVAAEQVIDVLHQCAARGVRSAIVLAGLPSGDAGSAIQAAIGDVAHSSGMTILGPNALGFWNPGFNVAATFAPLVEDAATAATITDRTISIVSHSGGIGNSIYDKCHHAGLGGRYIITTGNEADLEMIEVIDYLIEEGGSRIILAYIEGFKRPQDFTAVARKAADRGVAIIVLKAGSSTAGERAAVSHTGHMTGADTAYNAIFDRYGVLRAEDVEEMIAFARIIAGGRPMAGDNAMILSTGGGFGALLADACEARGIAIPDLDDDMKARLGAVIPDYGYPGNPVDLPGGNVLQDNGVSLARIIDDFGASPALDAVILCFGLDSPGRIERMRPAIGPSLERLKKPALFHSPTLVAPDNQRALAGMGVHQYTVPEAARALAALRKLTMFRERSRSAKATPRARTHELPAHDPRWTVDQTLAIFASFGIPLPPQEIATNADEAQAIAARFGYPVALKIQSPDIAHKSDVGGVVLGVGDAEGVAQAYQTVLTAVVGKAPTAQIDGILVQRMAGKGREFAIGVVRDLEFGLLLMLSVGGILIEVLDDAAFAPLPLGPGDARRMIDQLKGKVLLGSLRGGPASDAAALEQLLEAISDMAAALGDEIDEIEFNPVIVHPQGEGVSVVDFLVVHPQRTALP